MNATTLCDVLSRDADIRIVTLLKQYWKSERYSYSDRPRPNYGLMLLVSGEVKFVSREKTIVASSGELVFLPKNSCYEAVFLRESLDFLVNFDMDDEELARDNPFVLLAHTPLSMYHLCDDLIEELKSGSRLKTRALFYTLLHALVQEISLPSSGEQHLLEVAKHALTTTALSCDDIAKQCGISTSGLRRLFRESLGMTMTEYRTGKKIEEAKYLLEATGLSLSEIAEKLNFYDVPYFCKVFKQSTGLTPKAFLRSKQI